MSSPEDGRTGERQPENNPITYPTYPAGPQCTNDDVDNDSVAPVQLSIYPEEKSNIPSGALRGELATKQRIIDDVLQHLQKCMREKSVAEIQNEILRTNLNREHIEVEKLKKACQWYKSQLYENQKELRARVAQHNEERGGWKAELEAVKVKLSKYHTECEILNRGIQLERNKHRDHDLDDSRSFRHDSKDSGIFYESNTSSDTSSEVIELSSTETSAKLSSEDQMNEVTSLRLELTKQIEEYHSLSVAKDKVHAERDMWMAQCQLQNNLMRVQENNLRKLKSELEIANNSLVAKRKEHETAVNYLNKCRQQVDQLMKENSDIHRESLQMIVKFERIASILGDYRREIQAKNDQIQVFLLASHQKLIPIDRSTQTRDKYFAVQSCEQAVQTENNANENNAGLSVSSVNYYKNLLKVVDREYQQKLRQREINTRTLLKKLKQEMRRARELEEQIKVFKQQPTTSSQYCDVIAECKECDSWRSAVDEATTTIAQLQDQLIYSEAMLEDGRVKHSAEVGQFRLELEEKSQSLGKATKTIEHLEGDQHSLHSSLNLLKMKFIEMEKQVLDHAKLKDTAESERLQHHQMVMLLMQIKNERDDLLCQNEKLLRGLWLLEAQNNNTSSVVAKAKETLKRSAKFNQSSSDELFAPLSDGIRSVQEEVKCLTSAVRWQARGGISLLDELQAALGEDA